jgi:hypothetical protein
MPISAPPVLSVKLTFGELLKLMRSQKGLDGKTSISCVPRALVVPPALEVAAAKLVTAVFGPQPPISVVVEPRLTSASAYHLLADPSSVPAITYTIPDSSGGARDRGWPARWVRGPVGPRFVRCRVRVHRL